MPRAIAIDFETHLIQPGLLAPPIVCMSFADPSPGLVKDWRADFERALRFDLIVGANVAYDFGCALAAYPELFPKVWGAYERGAVFDIQIAARLTAIHDGRMRDGELYRPDGSKIQSGRYSLHECVREWLHRMDAKQNDAYRKSYALLENVPFEDWPEQAIQYPKDDAVNTLEVFNAQLARGKNLHDMPTQAWSAFCVHLGSIWGLRTDAQRVTTLKTKVAEHLESLRVFAKSKGFMRSCGTKDKKAIGEAVFKAYDGRPPSTESGNSISTSRETLEDSGDKDLEQLAELGKWEKFGTYLPALELASTKPLTTSCNILLSTGRASYDGLVQLMPTKGGVRDCFSPRRGNALVSVDYAAIEMSTLAQVCLWTVGYSDLANAINADKDPHCILGADLLGVSYDAFFKEYKAGSKVHKNTRQAAKAGNFGFPGMMGAAKFVVAQKKAGHSVCEWLYADSRCGERKIFEYKDKPLDAPLCARCVEQSEVIRSAYLSRWGEMRAYWRWVSSEVDSRGAVTQFVSKRVRGKPHAPAAANTLFQGLAADGAKRAVIALTREMYTKPQSPLYGSRLVVFAHDETILETPLEKLHDSAYLQAKIMVDEMRKVVPDVKVKAEPAAALYWYKEMETVHNAEGRLIPWEPK